VSDPVRRKPGRPPLDPTDPVSVSMNLKLPSKQFDAVYQAARQQRCSMPDLVRTAVRHFLRTTDEPDDGT
jgi:hypothetical protein